MYWKWGFLFCQTRHAGLSAREENIVVCTYGAN